MEIIETVIVDILAMLVTLGILVTVHEFGHFWVARRCGVKVECFSIGFGKALYSWTRAGTEYRIAALPLGGYVKMLGQQDGVLPGDIDDADKHLAFNHKTLAQRSAIIAAGPLANFMLAIVLYWIMFVNGVSGVAPVIGKVEQNSPAAIAGLMSGDEIVQVDGDSTNSWQEVRLKLLERMGESGVLSLSVKTQNSEALRAYDIALDRWLADDADPNILGSLGIKPFSLDIPARVGELIPGGRAETAGFQLNDLITAVNAQNISGWFELIEEISTNSENDLLITLERNGEVQVLPLRPELKIDEDGNSRGYIGVGVEPPEVMPTLPEYMNREVSYSIVAAVPKAFSETWDKTAFVLGSMKKMVVGLISVENLSGPITIAQVAGQTASYGLEYYIGFLAVLSISLGVLNLLPIPILDGGHLFYNLIEFVIRRPVPEKIQAIGMQLGVLLIAGIMFVAFYNDVNRLF